MNLTDIANKLHDFWNQAGRLANPIQSSIPNVSQVMNIGGNFVHQMQQNPIDWGNYQNQVHANQQNPFFNNTGNNPVQWAGKVAQDVRQRGPFEGLQDLSYPILMNPYVEPIEEPIVGNLRGANYQAGRPFPLFNALLGQTDQQQANPTQQRNIFKGGWF